MDYGKHRKSLGHVEKYEMSNSDSSSVSRIVGLEGGQYFVLQGTFHALKYEYVFCIVYPKSKLNKFHVQQCQAQNTLDI